MLTMETKVIRHFFQTTPKLKKLYVAWAGLMKGTKLGLSRESLTQDALGNALWLWARAQDPEEIARILEPYVDEFQAAWESREFEEVVKPHPSGLRPSVTKSERDLTADREAKGKEKNRRKTEPASPSKKVPVGNDKELEPDDVP